MRDLVNSATCSLCGHKWTSHDPADGKCDSRAEHEIGVCPCGRDLEWMKDRIMERARACLEQHVIGPEPESMTDTIVRLTGVPRHYLPEEGTPGGGQILREMEERRERRFLAKWSALADRLAGRL